jgi:hypothetical protein
VQGKVVSAREGPALASFLKPPDVLSDTTFSVVYPLRWPASLCLNKSQQLTTFCFLPEIPNSFQEKNIKFKDFKRKSCE